jgi:hypothetical protein
MIVRIRPGCYRFTSILATTRRGWQRYENLDQMPPRLRARCLQALAGRNSGTVLIAGRSRPEPEAEETAAPAGPAPKAPAAVRRIRSMGLVAVLFHLLTASLATAWLVRTLPGS